MELERHGQKVEHSRKGGGEALFVGVPGLPVGERGTELLEELCLDRSWELQANRSKASLLKHLYGLGKSVRSLLGRKDEISKAVEGE